MAAEVDIATLGIKVDATSADEAGNKLNYLAQIAANTENTVKGISSASVEMKAIMNATIGAINANTNAMGQMTDRMNGAKAASRGAAAAVDDMETRTARLRATIDPMGAAIDKVNAELTEARTLFEAGAMSANDYAKAQVVLNARSADFARRQGMMNEAMGIGARSAKLQGYELLNLSRQFTDIGVTAAMGMNPLMILVQQGPQIADVFATARSRGIGVADAMKQIGEMMLPWISRLASVGTVAGLAFGTLSLAARGASEGLGNVQTELGLTDKQMDKLKDKGTNLGFTMSDVMAGIASAVADAFDLDDVVKAWNHGLDYLGKDALDFIRDIVGMFGGMIGAIKAGFNDIPDAIAAVFEAAIIKYLEFVNKLAERGTAVINKFRTWLGLEGNLQAWQVAVPKMSAGAQGAFDAMSKGFSEGRSSAESAFDSGMASHRRNRILDAAGDADKERERKAKTNPAIKEYDNALKSAQEYIDKLKEETALLGKNELETKRAATAKAQATIEEAAHKAQLAGVAVNMQKVHNLTLQMSQAQYEWEKAWNDTTIRNMREQLQDEADALRFDNSLVGMNAEQRARATKQREIELQILKAERDGHWGLAAALKGEMDAVIGLTGAKAKYDDMAEAAARTATAARDMANTIKEATNGFGDLFGTAGEGFANLMNVVFDFQASQEESYAKLADLEKQRQQGQIDTAQYNFEVQRTQTEMANAQIANYGNMLNAAKTFFKEGTTGWKVLEAAERVYRLFQFAMMIRSMFMDKAQTASSVANSGARAAADGIAAVAKAIASLPFPLNLAAGAATLAFLVAIGVKMFGKGGGGSAAASAGASDTKASDQMQQYTGPRDEYGSPTSYYSVLRPGMTTVAGMPNTYSPQANSGIVINQGDNIVHVEGNMVEDTLSQIQPALDANREAAVQQARTVVQADIAAKSRRQTIGA